MIKYRKGYKYQLYEDAFFSLPIDFAGIETETQFILIKHQMMVIKSGYAWDGPSGPTIDDKKGMRGSLIHDAGYQLIRESHLDIRFRIIFDEILHQCCIDDGMNSIRAWIWKRALKRYGESAAIHNKDIFVAP